MHLANMLLIDVINFTWMLTVAQLQTLLKVLLIHFPVPDAFVKHFKLPLSMKCVIQKKSPLALHIGNIPGIISIFVGVSVLQLRNICTVKHISQCTIAKNLEVDKLRWYTTQH